MTQTSDFPNLAQQSIASAQSAIMDSAAALDPNYPRFHVAPPAGRLNDPNGLIHIDGTYHAFYQLGPFFPQRKAIYWGHASSTDLANWTTHDPAIAPDDWYDRNGVYSGGATVLNGITWLHYTGNVKTADGSREAYQCAATTSDFQAFEKCGDNPLVSGPPTGYTAHIRDPYIVPSNGRFTMYLGAQRNNLTGCILAYESSDLSNWTFLGEVEVLQPGYEDFGYMWECPNVFSLTDEETGESFDVLLFSPQGIDAQQHQFRNIFACGYVVGHLEGTQFHPAFPFTELDSGFEFYAPQVFTQSPESGREAPLLVMGWAGNASEDNQPSLRDYGWVHTLSTVRKLALRRGRLHQLPHFHLNESDTRQLEAAGTHLDTEDRPIAELDGERSFILELEIQQGQSWQIKLGKPDGPHVTLDFEPGLLHVDRSSTHYPHGDRRSSPIPKSDALPVTLVHDRSVTEVFVGDGHTAFTMRSYLDPDHFEVTLSGSGLIATATATIF